MSSTPSRDTSLTLLERVQKFPPESEAWDEFVRRYHPLIRAWCLKWGLQLSDADDVAQDVLVRLLTAMRNFRYDPSGRFSAWLKTVTRHALGDFATDKRKEPCQIASGFAIADLGAAEVDLARELQTHLDHDLLQMAMRRVENASSPQPGRHSVSSRSKTCPDRKSPSG